MKNSHNEDIGGPATCPKCHLVFCVCGYEEQHRILDGYCPACGHSQWLLDNGMHHEPCAGEGSALDPNGDDLHLAILELVEFEGLQFTTRQVLLRALAELKRRRRTSLLFQQGVPDTPQK